jgi:hypothetical protein
MKGRKRWRSKSRKRRTRTHLRKRKVRSNGQLISSMLFNNTNSLPTTMLILSTGVGADPKEQKIKRLSNVRPSSSKKHLLSNSM